MISISFAIEDFHNYFLSKIMESVTSLVWKSLVNTVVSLHLESSNLHEIYFSSTIRNNCTRLFPCYLQRNTVVRNAKFK